MREKNDDNELSSHVADPARLAALRAVALLDTPAEEAFDRLSRLGARFTEAPISLVTLIDADRQFFKSCLGIPEPWLSTRETPLTHSFCKHNRVVNQPLIIEDARENPLLKDNPAIRDLKVIAYLGIPLVTRDGYVLGSFCVIDSKPRHWTSEDVAVVESLAEAVMTEIQLRAEIVTRRQAEQKLTLQNEELRRAYQELERETGEHLRASEQLRHRDRMLIQQSRQAAMGEMISNIAHQWRQPLNKLALLAQDLPMSLRGGELSPEYLDAAVRSMMETIGHMSQTIDNFRNFFSPDKEKVEFHLLENAKKALSLIDFTLSEMQVEVEIVSAGDPVLTGYPNEYSQVLLNILVNARDAFVERATQNPRIRIEIGQEGEQSVLTVSDNAGGIPEEVIDRIFDPYFTTKGPDRGTGIGLYMSKMIIERNMGGSLTVSNVAGGTRFRIVV